MKVELHGIPEEIMIGDTVHTLHGVGTVTAISKPTSDRDKAKVEIDLGRKWMGVGDIDAIIIHTVGERRRSPEMRWDEHD